MKRSLAALAAFCCLAGTGQAEVEWQPWSEAAFERAARENKLVLLDVEAVWCHWCHVMDETTYADPEVEQLLRSHFVAIKVDQDSRPDISNRYKDYGWPATVIFKPDGTELVKLEGYVKPERMRAILRKLHANPVPTEEAVEVQVPTEGALSEALRQELHAAIVERYDRERAGWGRYHKFLNWDTVEYCLVTPELRDMARATLEKQKLLLDPVWGGVYQYSHGGVWENPHFEKIMSVQAENMRIYSYAYELWGDPSYLAAAQGIRAYLKSFLMSPEGAFYTSQDADLVQGQHSEDYFRLGDQERRARGIPRVDRHVYARENGWAIRSFAVLYAATGDPQVLAEAERAARWVIRERSVPGGGFRHDATGEAYLGDTLAMGRAFLELYAVTGEREWLERAASAAGFLTRTFPTFETAAVKSKIDKPWRQREEVVGVARFTNLLYHYTGQQRYRATAERALAYLAQPEVAREFSPAGVLLAAWEVGRDPVHVAVVGSRQDSAARALFMAAQRSPLGYELIEWWDPADPEIPEQYPKLKRSALYFCTGTKCSAPVFTPEEVTRLLAGPPAREGSRAGTRNSQ